MPRVICVDLIFGQRVSSSPTTDQMAKRKRVMKTSAEPADISGQETTGHVEEEYELEPGTRFSDDVPRKKGKWINRQRVLIFASRGINHRDRHLMKNLREMMPHSKTESKMNPKDSKTEIDEMCQMKNCNKCIFLENKKRRDLYMWISNSGRGPSAKFLVENIHTMQELKMTGNCLKGSRPLLSFDPSFDETSHMALLRELLTQTFGTPHNHPKSQPFFDHVYTFTLLDKRIWFRNYQILEEDGSLAEVGPRFVLNLVKIFDGSFGGTVLYSNPNYVSPNHYRRMVRDAAKGKYRDRVMAKVSRDMRQPKDTAYPDIDPLDDVFKTMRPEDAKGPEKNVFLRKKD